MLITTTGFYGTGSSAITNLFCECSGVCCPDGEYEMRFIHDPQGISDLEYNLIDNPNRHNTSHAIKSFKKMVDWNSTPYLNHHYERICNGQFRKIMYEYIENISLFCYRGGWHYDSFEKGKVFTFIDRVFQRVFKKGLLSKNEIAYAGTFDESVFLEATQACLSQLLSAMNVQQQPFIMIDQMLPPTNLKRYLRYFLDDTIRVFVVDRDPRDLYLLEKLIWKGNVIPHYDVELFCKWFTWTRDQFKKFELPECVMKIDFEDTLYKYDETKDRILAFAGIDPSSHIHPNKILIPAISKKETKLWNTYPEYSSDMKIIEDRLECYLYDFPLS